LQFFWNPYTTRFRDIEKKFLEQAQLVKEHAVASRMFDQMHQEAGKDNEKRVMDNEKRARDTEKRGTTLRNIEAFVFSRLF
jgi:ribosomal protein S20